MIIDMGRSEKIFSRFILLLFSAILAVSCSSDEISGSRAGLTLIPPGKITSQVDLDIRAGLVNNSQTDEIYDVELYLDDGKKSSKLYFASVSLKAGESWSGKYVLETESLGGGYDIILKVTASDGACEKMSRTFEVVQSDIRSTRLIEGAWAGIYHWSEQEGKHWNDDIKKLDDTQWREMVRSMNKLGMNTIVIQEVFRNNDYVGQHSTTVENYQGRAFYPSELYPGRMPIAAEDPLEAILDEADRLGMSVMMGVGMFAWFDFTEESLEWHKKVAEELWDRYGHHESFYAFYISEECAGNLFNSEQTDEMKSLRKKQIADFFREFKRYVRDFAPEKPVMLATNSMGVLDGADGYPALLENLDILCPFGFARMPEGDLTGKEAADFLQKLCDDAGAHLWFDLEAFLFNPDMSLYPRPIEEIIHDLNLLDNFEKILCYQFPGVFSDPDMSVQVGEDRTVRLFEDYLEYVQRMSEDQNVNQ